MTAPSSSRGRRSWSENRYNSDHSDDSLELTNSITNSFDNTYNISGENATMETSPSNILPSVFSPEQSVYPDTDYFPQPVFYRVLCLGSVSQPAKKEVLRKISRGLIQVLNNDNSGVMPISRFKEVKHHLVVLSLIEGDRLSDIDNMDSFEDNGASLIEADFTWDSNSFDIYHDPHFQALLYAWDQTPPGQKINLSFIQTEVGNHHFNGFVYPDVTHDGVDLCIYFYGGDDKDDRTKKDFDLLWRLDKMGVIVLPITSVPGLNKKHIADRLSERRIKCLDLTGIEMETPSFRNNNRARRNRLDKTTPQLQPYEILDIDQLYKIQNRAIYTLLKKSRDRMVIREDLKKKYTESSIIHPAVDQVIKRVSHGNFRLKIIICSSAALVLLMAFLFYPFVPSLTSSSKSNWIATFEMDLNQQFMLHLNNENVPGWPQDDPNVWVNSKELIETKRVYDHPGSYHLIFSVPDNIIFFTLNSTVKSDKYILLNNQTFIWLDKPTTATLRITPTKEKVEPSKNSYGNSVSKYISAIFQKPIVVFNVFMRGDESP